MPAFVNQIPTNILIDLDRQYLVNFIAVPWSLLMEPPQTNIYNVEGQPKLIAFFWSAVLFLWKD